MLKKKRDKFLKKEGCASVYSRHVPTTRQKFDDYNFIGGCTGKGMRGGALKFENLVFFYVEGLESKGRRYW